MLFNSFAYLLLFLPTVAIVYFLLNGRQFFWAGKAWLILCSLFFYAYWRISFVTVIIISILVNHFFEAYLSGREYGNRSRRIALILGILFNVGLLGYFKYADFFVENANAVFGTLIPLPHITLPLGISFFTFQQIAYLVDNYKRISSERDFLNYSLFVCFFPQLVAGPIVHHKEMMPQFGSIRSKLPNWENIYIGFFFIALGLLKKVVVADSFAVWVNEGFSNPSDLNFFTAWKTSLCYTVQLYFDFSGYTDMAIGAARVLNIGLPQNFNAPYLALDIQDFWRRWHMTLGRFLRDYIYIPLGGNRKSTFRTYFNLFLTFLIGGIWHGAGWTFVLWGAMHGTALCIQRLWKNLGLHLPKFLSWALTFLFVNAAWVIFRADSLQTAVSIWIKMLDLSSISASYTTMPELGKQDFLFFLWLSFIILYVLEDMFFRTTQEWAARLKPSIRWTLKMGLAFASCMIIMMNQSRFTEFIYFQF
ncbi:MAG: MBOAT family protein [Desulfobacteraceae bacterium]|jgi:D-alanyl-lipoteichoic acid acyltransferase DltB (MBOAT superfamily)|nr:MAG: MBOAT family protein [Desulfobacteraceae bacterium]